MPLYRPSSLRHFLQQQGINPNKKLSQNFLIDGNIIRKIVDVADIASGDHIIEVGPGPGSLTEALLNAGATVLAVEKDRKLAAALERLQTEDKRLTVLHEDILTFKTNHLVHTKLVANLPYHLTTPILTKFLPCRHSLSMVVVMVQEEVAERLCAQPRSKDYSSFTVFVNYHACVKHTFHVSRHCFYPEPKVDSAVVRLDLVEPPHVSNEEKFFTILHTAFQQRRKMLRSSLKVFYSPERIMQTLSTIEEDPLARPEELSLKKFLLLFEELEAQ